MRHPTLCKMKTSFQPWSTVSSSLGEIGVTLFRSLSVSYSGTPGELPGTVRKSRHVSMWLGAQKGFPWFSTWRWLGIGKIRETLHLTLKGSSWFPLYQNRVWRCAKRIERHPLPSLVSGATARRMRCSCSRSFWYSRRANFVARLRCHL